MKKNNNQGLSLVELLIALAISSLIVVAAIVLVSQGMKSSQRQTLTARLQEDAGIAMNQISDSIMETTYVDVSNYTADEKHYTQVFKMKRKNNVGADIDYSYKYDDANNILTVDSSSYSGGGSILCQNVTDFRVQIINTSVRTEKNGDDDVIVEINDPVQIKVTMQVSSGGITREISRVTSLRNKLELSNLKLQVFEVDDFGNADVLDVVECLTD